MPDEDDIDESEEMTQGLELEAPIERTRGGGRDTPPKAMTSAPIAEHQNMSPNFDPPVVDIEPPTHEDTTRRWITFALLALLGGVATAAFILVGTHWVKTSDTSELLDQIYGPIVALAGTAIGFYFADRRGGQTRPKSKKR